MAKQNTGKNYLSGREIRAIAKANAKEVKRLEAYKNRKAPESDYLTTMRDDKNILESSIDPRCADCLPDRHRNHRNQRSDCGHRLEARRLCFGSGGDPVRADVHRHRAAGGGMRCIWTGRF